MANGWNDPRLKVIDLKWAALDPADSIFTKLEPRTERVVSAADIARATTEPPEDTRAWLRAKLVAQFGDEVAAASWSRLTVRDPRAADEGEAVEFYGNAAIWPLPTITCSPSTSPIRSPSPRRTAKPNSIQPNTPSIC